MSANKVRILSTRPLDPSLAAQASQQGILLESMSFIETHPILDEATCRKTAELAQAAPVVVFTSMNAVDAVAACLRPAGVGRGGAAEGGTGVAKGGIGVAEEGIVMPGKIFCIGSATRERVLENFGEGCIGGTADSAAGLADTIIGQGGIKEVVFFCGDHRRDELPKKLWDADIRVKELVVYQTRPTPHTISDNYEGLVFFSPSAVDSFFSTNTLSADTVLFAIGHTTADAIRNWCINPVIVSDRPGKDALIRQVMDHFSRPGH